jgi:hypothetical protein
MAKIWAANMSEDGSPYFCHTSFCHMKWVFIFAAVTLQAAPPNILLILADDLGYGDVRCYNSDSKVATPNIDKLASEGMRFTDAHSPATVCTPSRYSLMTGQMAFRVPSGGTVFQGTGGPSLIAPGKLTLPGHVEEAGLCHGGGRQMAHRAHVSRSGRRGDPLG